jgi:hypothetical protein
MRSRSPLAIPRLSGGSQHRRGVQRRAEVGNCPAARPMDGAKPLSFPQAGSQLHRPVLASAFSARHRPTRHASTLCRPALDIDELATLRSVAFKRYSRDTHVGIQP